MKEELRGYAEKELYAKVFELRFMPPFLVSI
jgi:hypothetical protein